MHVVDTITPDMQELIFERFRQGNSRVSCEHGGMGLALSHAYWPCSTLTVESQPGQGARFTLSLPRGAAR